MNNTSYLDTVMKEISSKLPYIPSGDLHILKKELVSFGLATAHDSSIFNECIDISPDLFKDE